MTTFGLDRLFQDGLAVGLERNGLAAAVISITAAYPPEVRRQISAVMAEVITTETHNDGIEIDDADGTRAAQEQLHSELLRVRSSGMTQKITFLRIKDATVETIVPLVSMALIAWGGDMKAVVPGLQGVTMLWKNLVTLRRETDSTAIDVYEALVATRAANRAARQGPPTTEAIIERVPNRSVSEVIAALKRLGDLKLVEVAFWGGVDGDFEDQKNTWKVRL